MNIAVIRMKVRLYISWLMTSLIMGHCSTVHTYLPVPSLQDATRIISRVAVMRALKNMVRDLSDSEMRPSSTTNHWLKADFS